MHFNQQWNSGVALLYSSTISSKKGVRQAAFCFDFYGHTYVATIDEKCIALKLVLVEGPTELWDSFEAAMQGEYWPKLQDAYEQHFATLDEMELSEG